MHIDGEKRYVRQFWSATEYPQLEIAMWENNF